MSGFKISFNSEIRRLPASFFCVDDWAQFCNQLRELFRHELPGLSGEKGAFRLRYTDDEDEVITVKSSDELKIAIELSQAALHLTISRIKCGEKKSTPEEISHLVEKMSSEVGDIRNHASFNVLATMCEDFQESQHDFISGSCVFLKKGDDETQDCFFLDCRGKQKVFLTPQGGNGQVRFLPSAEGPVVNFFGGRGPFAQFFAIKTKEGIQMHNQKVDKYLTVVGGALAISSDPCSLLVRVNPSIKAKVVKKSEDKKACKTLSAKKSSAKKVARKLKQEARKAFNVSKKQANLAKKALKEAKRNADTSSSSDSSDAESGEAKELRKQANLTKKQARETFQHAKEQKNMLKKCFQEAKKSMKALSREENSTSESSESSGSE